MNLIQCIQEPEAKEIFLLLFYFSLSVTTERFAEYTSTANMKSASSKISVMWQCATCAVILVAGEQLD